MPLINVKVMENVLKRRAEAGARLPRSPTTFAAVVGEPARPLTLGDHRRHRRVGQLVIGGATRSPPRRSTDLLGAPQAVGRFPGDPADQGRGDSIEPRKGRRGRPTSPSAKTWRGPTEEEKESDGGDRWNSFDVLIPGFPCGWRAMTVRVSLDLPTGTRARAGSSAICLDTINGRRSHVRGCVRAAGCS